MGTAPISVAGGHTGTVPIFVAGGQENGTVPFRPAGDSDYRAIPAMGTQQRQPVPPLATVLDVLAGYDFRVTVGFPYATENGLYNTYLFHHRGEYQMYHKINLFPPFNEPEVFSVGPVPGVWETDFGRVGVAICYDIRFPEVFEELKARSVERIFIPAAFPRERAADYRALLVERARQTGAWVIGINAVGSDERQEYGGSSSVIEPDGTVAVQADETTETLLELDF